MGSKMNIRSTAISAGMLKGKMPDRYTVTIEKINNGFLLTARAVYQQFSIYTGETLEKFVSVYPTEEEARQKFVDFVAETITRRY